MQGCSIEQAFIIVLSLYWLAIIKYGPCGLISILKCTAVPFKPDSDVYSVIKHPGGVDLCSGPT